MLRTSGFPQSRTVLQLFDRFLELLVLSVRISIHRDEFCLAQIFQMVSILSSFFLVFMRFSIVILYHILDIQKKP